MPFLDINSLKMPKDMELYIEIDLLCDKLGYRIITCSKDENSKEINLVIVAKDENDQWLKFKIMK